MFFHYVVFNSNPYGLVMNNAITFKRVGREFYLRNGKVPVFFVFHIKVKRQDMKRQEY